MLWGQATQPGQGGGGQQLVVDRPGRAELLPGDGIAEYDIRGADNLRTWLHEPSSITVAGIFLFNPVSF